LPGTGKGNVAKPALYPEITGYHNGCLAQLVARVIYKSIQTSVSDGKDLAQHVSGVGLEV